MYTYRVERGPVDIGKLEAGLMDEADYIEAHKALIIPCHDIFIEYEGGILLARRRILPAIGILWPIGGRIRRGVQIEDSLVHKVWEEAQLEIEDLSEIGYARTYFQTDPFNHGKGTDTINFVYHARGKGTLKLDRQNEEPTIIQPKDFKSIKGGLHPYVADFMTVICRRFYGEE